MSEEILASQLKNMAEYYSKLSEREEELYKFKHDVKNLLIALHTLIESNQNAEALRYIEGMEAMCKEIMNCYETGNYIADSLLNTKLNIANNICTKIVFEGIVPVKGIMDIDLCILLSNLLDNALEACEKIEGQKEIVIESIVANKMWFFTIRNPVGNTVLIHSNKIRTTKKNKAMHGYGLLNIQRVVEKYNGHMSVTCEEGIFTFRFHIRLMETA